MGKLDQLRELREQSLRGGGETQTHSVTDRVGQTAKVGATRKCVPIVANMAAADRNAQAGVASSPRKVKRGRPLDIDRANTLEATKPWSGQGMSRRTWYRRRREARGVHK